ncbi:prephenate dehydratase [Staphylococcus massiliensis]|uniref:prephenate dehydratase n=1 Tax=Staphylococcus massiliensis TaxID=555791 RepID=UPI001EDE5EB5|nr:prephenate dehydratase [Staphylococcus massiliensis]MCG3399922.1 prephenate dehydratase [Staphylococcus massiliensis]MCG3402641.1 prephenate dehydratase [Staphylococcus massiliensis]MCG3412888.1 prephenate dehydratase [Staphylococcus massiliensis]
MNIYYLGPKGTFSYLACQKYMKQTDVSSTLSPKTNLYEVIKATKHDSNSIAIVPIENSIEGTINLVIDRITEEALYVYDEIHLDIQFALYGRKGATLNQIKHVYSIAPAISQTQHFIHEHQLSYDYVNSTVQGLDLVSDTVGAIAPLGSGESMGLEPLAKHIEDYPHNVTRFLVIGNKAKHVEAATDTILLVTPKQDKPGLLASILNTFTLFNINLSWIESRPQKTELGMYHFYVQAKTPVNDELRKVITILETLDYQVKLIGSFQNHN